MEFELNNANHVTLLSSLSLLYQKNRVYGLDIPHSAISRIKEICANETFSFHIARERERRERKKITSGKKGRFYFSASKSHQVFSHFRMFSSSSFSLKQFVFLASAFFVVFAVFGGNGVEAAAKGNSKKLIKNIRVEIVSFRARICGLLHDPFWPQRSLSSCAAAA